MIVKPRNMPIFSRKYLSTIELKAEGSLKHLASCLKVIDYPLKDDILLDANLQATYNNQLEISKLNAKAMCINSDTPLEICAYDKILFNPQKREFICLVICPGLPNGVTISN